VSKITSAVASAGRLAGFATNLLILAVLSLVSLPVLISASGEAIWGLIALGQAVGLVLGVPWALGWGLLGVSRVARFRQQPNMLWREIKASVLARAALTPLVGISTVIAAATISNVETVLVVAAIFSTAALGLRMNWVFVGLQSPGRLFMAETLPRLAGVGAGIALLLWNPAFIALALFTQGFGSVVSFVATAIWARSRATESAPVGVVDALRSNLAGVPALTASALWGALPTFVVSWLAPAELGQLALVLRVQAQANTATSPVIDVLQGWVPVDGERRTRKRALMAALIATALAVVGSATLLGIGSALFAFLGAGVVMPSLDLMALSAGVVGLTFVSQTAIRAGLAPLALTRAFSMVVYVGMAVGAALMLLLVPTTGAGGALWALIACLVVQVLISIATIVRFRESSEGS